MITVVYHSADFDGIFCREIAKKFLGEKDVQYIGWNFGDAKIPMPKEGPVYVLDLSPECLAGPVAGNIGFPDAQKLVWIDHHKTSIEKWPQAIPGYRIDGVAACRLAWQYFKIFDKSTKNCPINPAMLPEKSDFVTRKVSEPRAVCLAGEYDVWDKRDPNAEVFQYGLRCSPITPTGWDSLLSDNEHFVLDLLEDGRIAQCYQWDRDANLVTHKSFRLHWEGFDWLCLNTGQFNSLTFTALDKPETGHDALLGFMWNGKVWTVSLYHAAHRTDLDLSKIAVKHGGGGHRGACGFTCKELPFQLT